MTDKIKILFLAANPVDVKSPLQLKKEFEQIRERLNAAKERDRFELVSEWAVTSKDLQQILLNHEPHVLHFSGHGSKNQGIVLEDESGRMRLLDKQAFANLVKVLKDNIRMVVLNACYSVDQGKLLNDIVDFTIGMDRAIGDEAARVFASSFYQGLAFGRSVETAFELGKGQLDLSDIPESKKPKLLVRYGVSSTERLFPKGKADLETHPSEDRREETRTQGDQVDQSFTGTIHGDVYGIRKG